MITLLTVIDFPYFTRMETNTVLMLVLTMVHNSYEDVLFRFSNLDSFMPSYDITCDKAYSVVGVCLCSQGILVYKDIAELVVCIFSTFCVDSIIPASQCGAYNIGGHGIVIDM